MAKVFVTVKRTARCWRRVSHSTAGFMPGSCKKVPPRHIGPQAREGAFGLGGSEILAKCGQHGRVNFACSVKPLVTSVLVPRVLAIGVAITMISLRGVARYVIAFIFV